MMSYLWILLLGSLLATSVRAQDDAPAEEAALDPEGPTTEADAGTKLNVEPDEDEEAEHTAEEIPTPPTDDADAGAPGGDDAETTPPADDAEEAAPDVDDADPTPPADDAEAAAPGGDDDETTPPADDAEEAAPDVDDADPTPPADDAEAAAPGGDDAEPTPPTDDAEAAAPGGDDAEPTPAVEDGDLAAPGGDDAEPTPAVEDGDLAAPGGDDAEPTPLDNNSELAAEPSTPVADTEVEAAATTKAPADEVGVEEDPASTNVAPAQEESGPDDIPTTETDPTADDNEEEPTDPKTVKVVVGDTKMEVNKNLLNDVDEDTESGLLSAGKSGSLGAVAAGTQGETDEPQARASPGTLAGILCAIGVAAVGAVTGYFTYQRKQLCFKNRQEADPEAARKADVAEAQSDPQVLSNLLNSS